MEIEERRKRRRERGGDRKDATPSPIDRSMPVDLGSEMAVIGSVLLNPDVLTELTLIIRADDFFDDANRKIYVQLQEMYDTGRKIDIALLVAKLKEAGDFDTIGGAAYLGQVVHAVPNAAHAIYYADIVREKATMRRLIDVSSSILRDAYDEAFDARELTSQAEQRIFQIQDDRNANAASSISDVLRLSMARINARMKGEQLADGVMTHFVDFDKMTGGMHSGELLILAARPSMGKTALAMNIAEQVAMQEKVPVLFVSLEMSSIELADRLLCSVARVDGSKLRNGTLMSEERQRLVQKAMELSNSALYIDDAPSRTVSEVAAVARRITTAETKKTGGRKLGLIVIDYLQLLQPDNPKDPRQEQVAKIARRLKMLARELETPILCLAQLNRQAEDSKDHLPKLSHLRESGAIEQDADVVMFVHRDDYYAHGEEADALRGMARIIIAKQRNGPVGDVELVWERDYTRFSNKAASKYDDFDVAGDFSTPGGY